MSFNPELHPHRRFNPLMGEWTLVSPHRALRPWQGAVEKSASESRLAYDEKCYLCPGNPRVGGGAANPKYTEPYVFTNDFQAILPDTPILDGAGAKDQVLESQLKSKLFRTEPVQGTCRVICFSPRHDLTLPEMQVEDVAKVIDVWASQVAELGAHYRWVQIFENKGPIMGCSNPHPHGQIWAGNFLPRLVEPEDACQKCHAREHQSILLLDYLRQELEQGARVVDQNEHWVMVVPYWATWPFELLLLPCRHVKRLPDLTPAERLALAEILKLSLTRYDNLFETSFPYSMGWHGAPNDDANYDHWQLHAHFYPPLLRSATVKKFMVGYEMLAEPQRDLTPEQAAQRLSSVTTTHYRQAIGVSPHFFGATRCHADHSH